MLLNEPASRFLYFTHDPLIRLSGRCRKGQNIFASPIAFLGNGRMIHHIESITDRSLEPWATTTHPATSVPTLNTQTA